MGPSKRDPEEEPKTEGPPKAEETKQKKKNEYEPPDIQEDDMQDENEDEFDIDEAAIDLSLCPQIKCIESYPAIDDLKGKIKKMMDVQLYNYLDLIESDQQKD